MDDEGAGQEGLINRIRELPSGKSPEDVMRTLASSDKVWRNRETVMKYLYDTLEEHPEIEGVIGYSEGSAMAATWILDEVHRLQTEGRPRRIKCAVFFTGWPPGSVDNEVVLADESDIVIDVPTLHIVGANGECLADFLIIRLLTISFNADPYRYGALALYNVCDADTAQMFDTGKGHTIPRAGKVITELADAVRELISRAEE